jgi:two-component SAPR family response regulator
MAKRRILIVEDDFFIAADLEAIASKAVDAEVVCSRSVARAKTLVDHSLDIALLDVDVTNGKTFEVATLLRQSEVPFVFLSGSPRQELPEELRDAPFIAKPYAEGQLLEHIRRTIPKETD